MTVPNTFANATTAIPLVQLDQNFNTGVTLGNTTVYLGNTTTAFGNVTLNAPTFTSPVVSSGTLTGTSSMLSPITNSLTGNVALNNTANYFTGPTVAQGSTGTWFASGSVVVLDSAAGAIFDVKLWDGTTVIAEARVTTTAANQEQPASVSGFITSPASNIRISVRDVVSTNGQIRFNSNSDGSKTSTVTAIRIG
jgi:hypothetical protein